MNHAFENYKCAVCGTLESILTQNEKCPIEPVEHADIFTIFFQTTDKEQV